MKLQRVYTDTSVIGGCFDSEFESWSEGLMQDFRLGLLLPVVSVVVAAEIEPAPEPVREQFAELMRMGAEVLDLGDEVRDLATAYAEREILPPKFSNDALHIALATVGGVDVLVSWNFKHIVRFDKIRLFNAVNLEHGYKPVQIYSPREVTSYGKEDAS
jgi:predicted nucleic acid-binding protein